MKIRFLILLTLLVTLGTGGVQAQSILDKITKNVKKGADAVESGVGKVGESIDSTVDLTTNEATPDQSRQKLDNMASDTLQRLFLDNASAKDLFTVSAGYAVFDTRKVTVFPVAAGFGRGVAVSEGTGNRTYMKMGTGGVGVAVGFGGFETQIVILFEKIEGFNAFVRDGYDATAETGAKYGDETSEETIRFVDGRSVFVLGTRGWRVAASAAGTKYWPDKDLN